VVIRIGIGAILFIAAVGMALAGLSLLLAGIYGWLAEAVGAPGAYAIVGGIFLICAVIVAWIARAQTEK
jgi:drug/metabolite transporter superfamily protein YnfA